MRGKVGGAGAGHKIAVGVMPVWQLDQVGTDAGSLKTVGELARGLRTGLVVIRIEGEVDGTARRIGKLSQLSRC